eukprot:TRINITY_DN11916_c0_g1_i1.p1 TRINITY_DN11916_c0_g1~~TRINITY_DN11916_c0_g1_i1.p1  ORF type:complete len:368 (+),score=78.41 TRINITY_DN11916_c0_g1_i1:232-1335(+)
MEDKSAPKKSVRKRGMQRSEDWYTSLVTAQHMDNVCELDLQAPSKTWRLSSAASEHMVPVKLPNPKKHPELHKTATWRLFVAGGVAGGIAKTVGSPLSRATILMQTQAARGQAETGLIKTLKDVIAKDGMKGLLRGNTADVLRSIPLTGLSFMTYGKAREMLEAHSSVCRSEHSILQGVLAGSASGAVAITATYPIDLLRTRMCVTTKADKGLLAAASQIVERHGFRALYDGLLPALAASVPKLASIFVVNDAVGMYLQRVAHWEDGPRSHLVSAVTAALVSSTITFPLDLICRSMQVQGTLPSRDARKFEGMVGCIRHLYTQHGYKAFYRGLFPELCKCVPVQATALIVNTWMLSKLGVRPKWEDS